MWPRSRERGRFLDYSGILQRAGLVVILFMRNFFARNIDQRGRIVRAVWGLALIFPGLLISGRHRWLSVALVVAGAFALYEAARGWCLMRACGIKTKL
jgi:hypothetical protein